jgi:pimeloyl-ACP methyl ester carboxylesterase
MPVTAATDTAALIGGNARALVLDGVGHFPWLEQPGVVRAALDDFLAEVPT